MHRLAPHAFASWKSGLSANRSVRPARPRPSDMPHSHITHQQWTAEDKTIPTMSGTNDDMAQAVIDKVRLPIFRAEIVLRISAGSVTAM
jgi:hypothetical protein